METPVIITFIVAVLIGWLAYLIFEYKCINFDEALKAKIKYYANRYDALQECMNELISSIHTKFPNSTIRYEHNNEGIERVEGEIKY